MTEPRGPTRPAEDPFDCFVCEKPLHLKPTMRVSDIDNMPVHIDCWRALQQDMNVETQRREKIREKFTTGALSTNDPVAATWGGTASGATCAVCDAVIEPGNVGIEAAGADGGQRSFHAPCYVLLTHECRRLRASH